jgi:hypothetical protein
MGFLSNIFGQKQKEPAVTLEASALFNAALQHQDSFAPNNDYTDQVFLTLDISRLHHATAKTYACFSRPEQTFKIPVMNDFESPMALPGSEAAFITSYTARGNKLALALVIRDQIRGTATTARNKHVVAAMSGVFNSAESFTPLRLIQAEFDPRGNVQDISGLPLTQDNTEKVLATIALNLQQILAGQRLDAMGNAREIRRMSPEALKSLTFTP